MENFDGDPSMNAGVHPFIDRAHTALAQKANDLVLAVNDVVCLKSHTYVLSAPSAEL